MSDWLSREVPIRTASIAVIVLTLLFLFFGLCRWGFRDYCFEKAKEQAILAGVDPALVRGRE